MDSFSVNVQIEELNEMEFYELRRRLYDERADNDQCTGCGTPLNVNGTCSECHPSPFFAGNPYRFDRPAIKPIRKV